MDKKENYKEFLRCFFVWIVLLLILILGGCSSVQKPALTPEVYYKRDMIVHVNKRKYRGVFVVPKEITYNLKVIAAGKNDIVNLLTCARDITSEKEGRSFDYPYTPRDPEERQTACRMELTSLHKKGKHAWGMMIVDQPEKYKLNGYLRCGEHHILMSGVSSCQTKAGLIQALVFAEEVKVFPENERCKFEADDSKEIVFETPKRECGYSIIGKDSGKLHNHYSVGYEEGVLRKFK